MSNSVKSFVGVCCLLLCLGLCGLVVMVVIPRSAASAKSRPSSLTPAQTCNYSITPNNTTIGAAGGSGQVAVTTTPGCAWTATEFSVNSAVELPRVFLNTTYVPSGRPPTMVGPDDNLQAAINAAQPGDVIMLEAGATYIQVLTLPNKPGSDYITIRTSAPDSSLPPPGTRITPSYANVMPKMVSPGSEPTLQALNNAHHYRFIGIEFSLAPFAQRVFNLIELGAAQTSEAQLPNNLIFDRVYIHGRPNATIRRGIALNSASTAIIDSYISDCHEEGADSQAIGGWNGSGPYKIVNNYLEGAGENVLFGGTDSTIPNLVPSDIEFRRNHCFKPLTWRVGEPTFGGIRWSVKNLFELKSAQRVLIDGNLFENNWQDAQNGYSILFTVRNQDGGAPWSVVQDITFTNNIVRRVAGVFNTIGQDTNFPSQISGRFKIANNLFEDVNNVRWGGTGTFLQIGATRDVWVDHNTILQNANLIFAGGGPSARFLMSNNLAPHNTFGIIGDGRSPGFSTIDTYFPDGVIKKNVIAGADPVFYPAFNFYPASLNDIGFVNLAGGNYRLSPASPFKNAGIDGKDLGCDFDKLTAAFGGNPQAQAQAQSVAPSSSLEATATPWLIISSNNTGVGNGVVGYSVLPNNGPARTGSVTIAGRTFTVSQASGCTFPLSPSGQFVDAAGGNNTIDLRTTAGCSWTAVSNDPWITITSGASGAASGVIRYTVAPNLGPARTGTLTIGGGTFTVNQQSGCAYTINPTTQAFPAGGGNGTVAVTAASGCTWAASNDDPWLKVTGGATGSGNGAVTFSVDVNPDTVPRTGRLILAQQIFTVTQTAQAPVAVVNAASYINDPNDPSKGAVTPGTIAAAFGAFRTQNNQTYLATTQPLPTILGGVRVTVNGTQAGLFFTAPSQINFYVPENVVDGTANVVATISDDTTRTGTVRIVRGAPGVFSARSNGQGVAAALTTFDGITFQSVFNPDLTERDVSAGTKNNPNYLVLYTTGVRYTPAANPNDGNGVAESVQVKIQGVTASVVFAGPAQGYTGLDQINAIIPPELSGSGSVKVTVITNGRTSNEVTIKIGGQ